LRFSESLSSGVLASGVGLLLNTFKLKPRRGTLFFEELVGRYVKECEKRGSAGAVARVGEEWLVLGIHALVPDALKSLPARDVVNSVLRPVWTNLGILGDISAEEKGNRITISTADECVTRVVGKNAFCEGIALGVVEGAYGRKALPVSSFQSAASCKYEFELTKEAFSVPSRPKAEYDRLNKFSPPKGFALGDALRSGVMTLRGNRLFYRGRPVWYVENTLFHLIGASGACIDAVPAIARDFFGEWVDAAALDADKLALLKNALQILGWGVVVIEYSGRSAKVVIQSPPHGLQAGPDNYAFLAASVCGFLRLVDSKFVHSKTSTGPGSITLVFTA
jgi:hypothetical protein